ncbi:MAG: hypothetical protein ACJ8AM_00845 [Gemmatimonadales bacterium]
MSVIHALLRHSIDYAGLFPPAGLGMREAVDNFARYLSDRSSWALGRFVVPAQRLGEFEVAAQPLLSQPDSPSWRLSALLAADLERDLSAVTEFNRRSESLSDAVALIDSVELKADSTAGVRNALDRVPRHLQAYIEIPLAGDPGDLIGLINRAGRRAKVRTGGTESDAFPQTADLARFIVSCVRAAVPFKAPAGLHHAFRAEYPLTYAPESPRGTRFGFLNLFLAAAFVRLGLDQRSAENVLEEGSLEAFQVEEDAISWQGQRVSLTDLEQTREQVMVSFGSCSFIEPLQELYDLHLLHSRVPQA